MSYLGKAYNYVKQENLEELLKAVGLPEDRISVVVDSKPTHKIVQNGDSYVITYTTPKGVKETTFKSGVEFEDVGLDGKTPITNTITVSGNTLTQTINSPLGAATIKWEFNGDELVVSMTTGKYNGVAKRYFKA